MLSRSLLAVAAGLVLVLGAGTRADFLVDDLEHAGARNYMGGDWGFADDHYNGGVSRILNADSVQFGPQPADYRWVFRGDYGEGVEGGTSNAAVMQYQLGSVKPPAGGNPNVSLKCDFIQYGEAPVNLTGSTGFSFNIRADQATRIDVALGQNFGKTGWYPSYSKLITASTDWQKVTVLWSEMVLPTWAAAPKPLLQDFIAACTGISFAVDAGNNTNPAFSLTGKLLVDSVVILGMDARPVDKAGFCSSCITSPTGTPQAGYPLTSFDAADALLITIVNDVVKTSGIPNLESDPRAAATEIESSPVTVSTGYNGTGGAKITYKLGPTVVKEFTQTPSAKIIVPLKKATWDSCISGQGTTGVSFLYKTSFGSSKMVEVTVASAIIYKGYAAPYVTMPGTNNEWMLATLTWDKFILPSWSDKVTPVFEKLSEMTIGYTGNQDDQGAISIDNVVITGITSPTLVPYSQYQLGIRTVARSVRENMRATVTRVGGALQVGCDLPGHVQAADIEILDLSGKLMGKGTVSASSVQARLPRIGRGTYIIRIRTRNGGRDLVLPVTVTR